MITIERKTTLQQLVTGASHEELVWINGYLSGLLEKQPAVVAAIPTVLSRITLAYGTETGNSKALARKLAAYGKQQGCQVKVVALEQYKPAQLQGEDTFVVIVSTQGDGDPPQAAQPFFDYLGKQRPQLEPLKYAVLALGDSSYPRFCEAGLVLDQLLQQSKATRIHELLCCDTDYEGPALAWFSNLLAGLGAASSAALPAQSIASAPVVKQQHAGTIVQHIQLNDRGSGKATYHIEIAVADISYQPGDAVAIVPENPKALVDELMALMEYSASQEVIYHGRSVQVYDLLHKELNIAWLPERVVAAYAAIVQQEIPEMKMSLKDLLHIYPIQHSSQLEQVLQILEPIAPRQYSIASSPAAHPGELHLVVALNAFPVAEETRYGLCSHYLSQLGEETALSFRLHANNRFRLAPDEKDMIMIGPGTGIAPFRAFLSEREARMAEGRNWLFFGDRNFSTDFLYQTEIQDWLESGLLSRFNAAFSRDQEEKLYVQHRMQQHAAALYEWLEQGAWLYVCGAKYPMACDVETMLLDIIATQSGRTAEEAQQFLETLEAEGRYAKDVY